MAPAQIDIDGLLFLACIVGMFAVGIFGFLASGEMVPTRTADPPPITTPRVVPHWGGGTTYSHPGG